MNDCTFEHKEMKEMLKIMLLQHMVGYHEAHNWIWLQDQQQLTYHSLLSYCHLLETWCKHYQKAKEKGWTDLTSLTAATASSSGCLPKCPKCGYPHPNNQCPDFGWECYSCSRLYHYMALCRRPRRSHHPARGARGHSSHSIRARSPKTAGPTRITSTAHPGSAAGTVTATPQAEAGTPTIAPAKALWLITHTVPLTNLPRKQVLNPIQPRQPWASPAVQQHYHLHLEGRNPLMDWATDVHVTFYTAVQLIMKQVTKPITVKIDSGVDANKIPLSMYHKPSQISLLGQDNLSKKPFSPLPRLGFHMMALATILCQFIANVEHKTEAKTFSTHFYVFKDEMKQVPKYSYHIHLLIDWVY